MTFRSGQGGTKGRMPRRVVRWLAPVSAIIVVVITAWRVLPALSRHLLLHAPEQNGAEDVSVRRTLPSSNDSVANTREREWSSPLDRVLTQPETHIPVECADSRSDARLLEQVLRSQSESIDERETAARLLAESGDVQTVRSLLGQLAAESDPAVRDLTVRSLQALHEPDCASLLLDHLLALHDDYILLSAVAEAFARIANGEAVSRAVWLYENQATNDWQRENLRSAVANTRSLIAVPALTELLLSSTNPPMRYAAASALSGIGDEDSGLALVLAVEQEPGLLYDDHLVHCVATLSCKDSYALMLETFGTSSNVVLRHAAATVLANAGEEGRAYALDALR